MLIVSTLENIDFQENGITMVSRNKKSQSALGLALVKYDD